MQMLFATARGLRLRYEIVGDAGPWIAISPGGRRPLDGLRPLARKLSAVGHRVLLHDRRNCGYSDVAIDGVGAEYEVCADDLHELLAGLGISHAWIGGGSSGCRLSLAFALRYPERVDGLLLWRITGGPFAARRLAHRYYGQYIDVALDGGMAAVCETEHFAQLVANRPENGDRLLSMSDTEFVEVMTRWRTYFAQGVDDPVLGATESQLRSIVVPTVVVPGNDNTHSQQSGELAHDLLPNSRLCVLYPNHEDVDLIPADEWRSKEDEMAEAFLSFMEDVPKPTAS